MISHDRQGVLPYHRNVLDGAAALGPAQRRWAAGRLWHCCCCCCCLLRGVIEHAVMIECIRNFIVHPKNERYFGSVPLAYQPSATSTFLSQNERTSQQILFSRNKLPPATSQTSRLVLSLLHVCVCDKWSGKLRSSYLGHIVGIQINYYSIKKFFFFLKWRERKEFHSVEFRQRRYSELGGKSWGRALSLCFV
jgi:hypothetical protein